MEKVVSFLTALVMTISGFFFPQTGGEIYLLGESHSNAAMTAKELELWGECYDQGMRDLFVEFPYYMGEYLNLWMDAPDDTILTQIFADISDTAGASQVVWDFFHTIKEQYPETVFHGTDVGHCYETMGARYLAYLEQTGQKDSEAYRITLENIEQGRSYYEDHDGDYAYREPLMVQNFQRAYDALPAGTSVMGIYGAEHTNPGELDPTGSAPNMASQLQEIYGDKLHSTDLTATVEETGRAGETQTVTIGGQAYTAVLLAAYRRPATGEGEAYWQVPGAYDVAKGLPLSNIVYPLPNFPCETEQGQVYIVETTQSDGTVERNFCRTDGEIYYDMVCATGFIPEG